MLLNYAFPILESNCCHLHLPALEMGSAPLLCPPFALFVSCPANSPSTSPCSEFLAHDIVIPSFTAISSKLQARVLLLYIHIDQHLYISTCASPRLDMCTYGQIYSYTHMRSLAARQMKNLCFFPCFVSTVSPSLPHRRLFFGLIVFVVPMSLAPPQKHTHNR